MVHKEISGSFFEFKYAGEMIEKFEVVSYD